jgi:hypothetical protein
VFNHVPFATGNGSSSLEIRRLECGSDHFHVTSRLRMRGAAPPYDFTAR